MTNLAHALTNSAANHPHSVAIKLDDSELTYEQLDAAASQLAGLLIAKGIEPGDRVGLMLPNVPYFPIIYYGILKAGAVVVPMNVLLKGREVKFYVDDPGAKLLFAWDDFKADAEIGAAETDAELILVKAGAFEQLLASAEPIADVVEREHNDTAVILYTSGTTGTPKGAELTHHNLASNAKTAKEMFNFTPDDVIFGGLPLFHSFGQTSAMNAGITAGSSITLLPRFDPAKALEIITRDGVTVFKGVPTMYVALLNHPDAKATDASSLRYCVSGGASLPVEILSGIEELFGCKMLEGYGLSETSPISSFNQPSNPSKPGSIGTPIPGVEIKLFDEADNEVAVGEVGEVVIRGENVMKGYWQRPEATAETMRNGWFHSGDLAKVDDEGYLYIVDRKKDLIIRGGYNVYPREIEEVLYEHPAVLEVAVLAIPHAELGEEVGAAIALKPGHTATEAELRDFMKERVAAYKYPRAIWFLEELPKGPSGKIVKREIEVPSRVASSVASSLASDVPA